jgi:8-amino-7-oxononanoate synthase
VVDIEARWADWLEGMRAEGRHRRLSLPRGVDFCSNDYLGFGKDAAERAEIRGLTPPARLAWGGVASRLLRGHHAIWEDVESSLAAWHGAEAALIFTSGYVANEGLLATVIEPRDWVASDEFNHASIIDGLRLSKAERFVFRHNDLDHLENGLQAADRSRGTQRQVFVVTESLFGMEGDRAPLAGLVDVCERYGARLIVDEAHATGCFGSSGSGLVDEAGLRQRVLASMHTGGKALAVTGAYVCGSAMLRELLINRCRHFIFTTALPPIIGTWWLESIERVKTASDRRQKLGELAAMFRKELHEDGVTAAGEDYIVSVLVGDDYRAMAAAEHLQAGGWDIRAIRPPSVPEGTARLRISIHADHDVATLTSVARAVAAAVKSARAGVP